HAKPLLQRYDIPATVFVTTGAIGEQQEFWWDELDRILLRPGTLPATLRLCVDGITYDWDLQSAAVYRPEQYGSDADWSLEQADDPGPRQRLCRALHQLMRPLPALEQRKVRDQLVAWAGAGRLARPTHRRLSPDELLILAQGSLVEVGAHTVTHPVLSGLP